MFKLEMFLANIENILQIEVEIFFGKYFIFFRLEMSLANIKQYFIHSSCFLANIGKYFLFSAANINLCEENRRSLLLWLQHIVFCFDTLFSLPNYCFLFPIIVVKIFSAFQSCFPYFNSFSNLQTDASAVFIGRGKYTYLHLDFCFSTYKKKDIAG